MADERRSSGNSGENTLLQQQINTQQLLKTAFPVQFMLRLWNRDYPVRIPPLCSASCRRHQKANPVHGYLAPSTVCELVTLLYKVQSILSWTGRIVALLCATSNKWNGMVPCALLSHPSKKQLWACSIFRKRISVAHEQWKSTVNQKCV
jgi:hypothetical protein